MYRLAIFLTIMLFSAESRSLLKEPLFDRLFSRINPEEPSNADNSNVQQLVALQRRSAELLLKATHLSAAIHNQKEAKKLIAEYSEFENDFALVTGRFSQNYRMVRSHGHVLLKQGENIDVAGIVDALINRLIELPKIIYCSVFVCKGQDDEVKRKPTKGRKNEIYNKSLTKFTAPVDESDTEDDDSEQPPEKTQL